MDQAAHEKAPADVAPPTRMEQGMTEIAALLRSLEATASQSGHAPPLPADSHENQLIQVRLGVASSLFMALRCKHAPTAGHSIRVAVGCSAWITAMDLDAAERDAIEVAALLHDVGKIGVPDHILQKPSHLTAEEVALMDQHRQWGVDIVRCCCAAEEILDIIRYGSAWFDGSKNGFDREGKELPLGARILAIVDAFDAMTTDHVYRQAMSRELALAELFECAGKQFDPDLVRSFSQLHEQNQLDLHGQVSQRWLEALNPDASNAPWQLQESVTVSRPTATESLFQQKMLENMHDGVVFVDNQSQIFLWNHSAERLTGIAAAAAAQRTWLPSLVTLRDDRGRRIADEDCPAAQCMATGVQSRRRLSIKGSGARETPIDFHAVPVVGNDGTRYGAALLLDDISNETSLAERCQSLNSQVTKDPMTQVANRAEFDRVHELFLGAHVERNAPYSLIICDIDHFKSVNDTYGHQAGDDAIKSLAELLKSTCRPGDLAARYGGEEFVLLCADCSNAAAATRAEYIRRTLADLPQDALRSRRITASFGVTENQPGDTPETMLRRADRALLEAKATGRNRTVQLGTGHDQKIQQRRHRWWWPFRGATPDPLLDVHLATNTPMEIAVEKLRGFVADHDAQITSTEENRIVLSIERTQGACSRRRGDRPILFVVELTFSRAEVERPSYREQSAGNAIETRVHVVIRPKRDRDRRREQATDKARSLLSSLNSYLLARQLPPDPGDVFLNKAKHRIVPWLKRKE